MCVGGVGGRQRGASTDRLDRRTRPSGRSSLLPSVTPRSSATAGSHQTTTTTRTLDRRVDTGSLQYGAATLRPPGRRADYQDTEEHRGTLHDREGPYWAQRDPPGHRGATRDPPGRRDRCAGQPDSVSGVVLTRSKRDPDVVQNCTLCRHVAATAAAAAGGSVGALQGGCVDSQTRSVSNQTNDDDGVRSLDELDNDDRLERY